MREMEILNEGHKKLKHITYISDEEIANEITNDRREKFKYKVSNNINNEKKKLLSKR